jgi:hypothetical protein
MYKSTEYRINVGFFDKGENNAPITKGCNLTQLRVQPDAVKGATVVAPNPPYNPSVKPPLQPSTDVSESGDSCESILIFPSKLSEEEVLTILELIKGLPVGKKQEVLDELAGAISTNSIKRGNIPFVRGLVNAFQIGAFNRSLGVAVLAARNEAIQRRIIAMQQPVRTISGTQNGLHQIKLAIQKSQVSK